jgi:hypothetical protein
MLERADATLGDDVRRQLAKRCDQTDIRIDQALDRRCIAGHGGANEIDASRQSPVGVFQCNCNRPSTACRHFAQPAPMPRLLTGRTRSVASKAMISAPASARSTTSCEEGRDANRTVIEITLDQTDDRRIRRGANGSDVARRLDAQTGSTC